MSRAKLWSDLAPHGLGLAIFAGPDPEADTRLGSMLESVTLGLEAQLADIGGIKGLPEEVQSFVEAGLRATTLAMNDMLFPADRPKQRGRPRNGVGECVKTYWLVHELQSLRPDLSRTECCRRARPHLDGLDMTVSKVSHDFDRGARDVLALLRAEARYTATPKHDRGPFEDPRLPAAMIDGARAWARETALELATDEKGPDKGVYRFRDLGDDWPEDV